MHHNNTPTDDPARHLLTEVFPDHDPSPTTNPSTPSHYRDPTPPTPTGATPVQQPGRPAMSQRATDISVITICAGTASPLIGGGIALGLWRLEHTEPLTLGLAGGVPLAVGTGVALVIRAFGKATTDAASALPPGDTHHHHHGPTTVENTELHVTTRGLGRTTNHIDH